MNNEHMRALIGLLPLLLIVRSVSAIQIGNKVASLRLSLYYSNPHHEAAEGYCDRSFNDNWCDTYFRICFSTLDSSAQCNIGLIETDTHYDKSYIAYAGDNAIQIPLKHPIPNNIRIEISAYDNDRFTSHDFIASFKNDDLQIPAPNISIYSNLGQVARTGHNGRVNITAYLSLECIQGYYGKKCSIECFAEKYPSILSCNENGTSICVPGFRGQLCDKPDACFYKPCIPGAECINADTTTGYKCICGGTEGVHCRAGYNPCVPSPCKHQGQCVRTGEKHDTFTCNCPIQWTGKLCDVQRSPCEVASQKLANADLQDLFGVHKTENNSFISENSVYKPVSVCEHGGLCVDLMDDFKFVCNCTRGWKGKLCDVPDWKNVIITGCVVTGLLVILICAIAPCCLRLNTLRQRKSPIPAEPLIYSHGGTKCPITERIPFKDIFYNSVILSGTLDSQSADRKQPFYEYCTVNTPSFGEGDMVTFMPSDYETLIDEKPPPELPIRPDSLAPLSKSLNTSVSHDSVLLNSPRTESLYSRQPLLTPRNSAFCPVLEDINQDYRFADTLPKRSVEDKETTLPKLLRIAKK